MVRSFVRRLVGGPAPAATVLQFDVHVWLAQQYSISTLLDLGANDGQHGAFIARIFRVKRAFFFEPQPQYADALRAVATGIKSAEVFELALGDEDGEAELHAMAHP